MRRKSIRIPDSGNFDTVITFSSKVREKTLIRSLLWKGVKNGLRVIEYLLLYELISNHWKELKDSFKERALVIMFLSRLRVTPNLNWNSNLRPPRKALKLLNARKNSAEERLKQWLNEEPDLFHQEALTNVLSISFSRIEVRQAKRPNRVRTPSSVGSKSSSRNSFPPGEAWEVDLSSSTDEFSEALKRGIESLDLNLALIEDRSGLVGASVKN